MDAYFGSIFQLELLGLLCPCIQKEEHRNAVQAVKFLRGRVIQWNRSASSGGGFSLGKLFRSPSKVGNEHKSGGTAKIKIRDNEDGIPSLIVDSTTVLNEPTVVNGSETLDETIPAAPSIQLSIKLGRIDKVILGDDGELVLLAKPVPSNPKPKELLRFLLLDDSSQLPAKDEIRNIFHHHLAVLVEWERQRRYELDDLYDEEDDDENQPNFLQARANKAAHFAKREVEMQQTKRDREQRKAKFSSAGMKYTALAMANQHQSIT